MLGISRETFRNRRNTMQIAIRDNEEWLQLMSPAQRRKLIKAAIEAALFKWRREHLWKRISADHVRRPPFNYPSHIPAPMIGWRRPNARDKLMNAIFTGKITGRVPTPKKETDPIQVSGTVAIPMGHAVSRDILRVMQQLPDDELDYIVAQFAEQLTKDKGLVERVPRGKNKGRLRLSPEQRERLRRPPRARRR